jgi:hypothetical protein
LEAEPAEPAVSAEPPSWTVRHMLVLQFSKAKKLWATEQVTADEALEMPSGQL